jgi:hypothetical protein
MPQSPAGNVTGCLQGIASERTLNLRPREIYRDAMARPANRTAGLVLAVPLLLMTAGGTTRAGQTRVYRCITASGQPEFRQTPCSAGSEEQELTIEDRRTGWTPPRETHEPPAPARKRPARSADDGGTQTRREEQCWKKHQQLDEVNWRLRRGYKPAQGDLLRHRRRSYEDYIDHYCR